MLESSLQFGWKRVSNRSDMVSQPDIALLNLSEKRRLVLCFAQEFRPRDQSCLKFIELLCEVCINLDPVLISGLLTFELFVALVLLRLQLLL